MAFGVREEGEGQPELGDLGWRYDRLGAGLSGFLQVGGGVVDLDVRADLVEASVLGGADAAADVLVGGLNEAVAGSNCR